MKSSKRLWEFFFVLALVSVFASWNSNRQEAGSQPDPAPDAIARWEELYKLGNEQIHDRQMKEAIESLSQAAEIATQLPAGDHRVAETFDDLGLAYYQSKELEKAKLAQGKAVAALLLSQGPEASDLNIFLERYGYATSQTIHLPDFPAYSFVGTHPPYGGERFQQELDALIALYEEMGNKSAVTYLGDLK
jgi:tetratricopeptide (TPR) repeat protein